ncbi:protein NARROW LEAF 1-like [Musa acuminata AAA Group]|uniref:protein NARROW LEAF 1-like n=1 Tax=Musa acuminata AAA Group TaxID=214697 RepID=UPI0031D51EC6
MRHSDTQCRHSGSTQSDESALDMERNLCNHLHSYSTSPIQPIASGGQHSECAAAYFSWPTSTLLHGAAEGRANYFGNLQKGVLPAHLGRLPKGQQATTLLDLMTIRAFHSKILRRYSLGTAIGFRIRKGTFTNIPAILVFVARKVHRKWLSHSQCLPSALEGPGGVWCDVDVVEFSYYGAPAPTPKEQLYNELVDGLRGSDPCIGSGSQVASQETYGTLGAIVKSRTGNKQVGFLTNRHVAVDLDYPNQKMFHPLPPNLGPGVYLGAVERATSFITDDVWYGIYAGTNPETFVRADGAFIPFADDFDVACITTTVKGLGEIGNVKVTDLQSPINSLIGRQVVKVGRSSGLTTGIVVAYALEYNDEKGICFLTDFLVVGENQQTFDLEGDSGSLIILSGQDGEKPQPIGIIWGGTANRGRLKLKSGQGPENWTSGVDLGRLLDLLELDLITTSEGLQDALREQRFALAAAINSTVDDSSPTACTFPNEKMDEIYEPLGINPQHFPPEGASGSEIRPSFTGVEFQVDTIEVVKNVEEHQFIPNFISMSPVHRSQEDSPERKNLSALGNSSDEDLCVSLYLGDREHKRQRSDPKLNTDLPQ